MVGDFNAERLAHAKKVGFEPIDLTKHDKLGELIAAGRRRAGSGCRHRCRRLRGARPSGGEQPAVVLNQMMEITRAAGPVGIPGLYVTEDPGRDDERGQDGQPEPALRPGLGQGAVVPHRARRR